MIHLKEWIYSVLTDYSSLQCYGGPCKIVIQNSIRERQINCVNYGPRVLFWLICSFHYFVDIVCI